MMLNPETGELRFLAANFKIGPSLTLESLRDLPVPVEDDLGPDLVPMMKTKAIHWVDGGPAGRFCVRLDFLRSTLAGVRLMAKRADFPPNLSDWDLKREEARHDFHCLWARRQLGWLWRLRRYPWGRVQALCGRNLDKTPRESILKVVYIDFGEIEERLAREFTT